ncbi:MAG: hypothetical protein WEA80_08560 [Gemmatimonadaceae bacterium]
MSITLVTTDYDSELEPYGIAESTDTATVCETWTGNDYVVYAKIVGSSDNVPDYVEDVHGADYQSGAITPFSASDAPVGPTTSAAPTAFDLMRADEAQRQASYDDPYYGVRAVDSCADGAAICEPAMQLLAGPNGAGQPVKRRGIRKLVEGAQELPRGTDLIRRFKREKGDVQQEFLIHPVTELLVGEEHVTPDSRISSRHTWKRVSKGWVRDRTEIASTEWIGGKKVSGRTTLTFLNVQTNAWEEQ